MALIDDLRQLAEQVRKRRPNVKGEEGTKQALIIPFLQVLGFDVYDPGEVQPEYVADFAKKKAGQFEKVDYAIHVNGTVSLFVECKAADVAPEDHDGQLARYFNATPTVKVAIITNGIRYRFFTDLQAPNVMDATPFWECDILSLAERDAEVLRGFTKDAFNPAAVQAFAEEIIFTGKVSGLINEILRNPSENFVRFLLGELDLVSGRVTSKVVERFVPVVRRSIQAALLDMMAKGLQQGIGTSEAEVPPEPPQAPPAPAASPSATDSSPITGGNTKVETTAEELEIFAIVSKVCAESQVKQAIGYKDTINYFGINLANKVTRWFARVFANGTKKFVVTKVPLEQAKLLARGFEVEATPESMGRSRVYYTVPADFDRLRSLVLVAFEEEAKRTDSPEGA